MGRTPAPAFPPFLPSLSLSFPSLTLLLVPLHSDSACCREDPSHWRGRRSRSLSHRLCARFCPLPPFTPSFQLLFGLTISQFAPFICKPSQRSSSPFRNRYDFCICLSAFPRQVWHNGGDPLWMGMSLHLSCEGLSHDRPRPGCLLCFP